MIRVKRLLSIILAAVIAVSAFTAYADYSDVPEGAFYKDSVERLTDLGVISGMGDGTFAPDNLITRAEFSVIAVKVANYKEGGSSLLFSDVPSSFWGAKYIATAAENKLIYGYPDGSFHPGENITYAQALTILMRLLGYSSGEIGRGYPYGYIDKAQELGICDGLSFNADDRITRGVVALVFDRALSCDMNGTSSKLMTKMDYSLSDEVIILGSGKTDGSILADSIATSGGTYKNNCQRIEIGCKAKLILNKDKEIVSYIKTGTDDKKSGTVESVTGNSVVLKDGRNLFTVNIDENALVYLKLSKTTFSKAKDSIEIGMPMSVFYAGGEYDYSVIESKKLDGPVLVNDADSIKNMWNITDKTLVIRDGNIKSFSDISKNDVVYYDVHADTLYAYCDKESGVYEEAYPTRAQVASIKLSGKEYGLESSTAVSQLSTAYDINDFITVALGKDGEIVAVIDDSESSAKYGLLLSCEKKTVDGTAKYYAKFLGQSGTVQEFNVDKDYASYRGRVCEYSSKGGVVSLSFMNKNSSVAGAVGFSSRTVGDYALSEDAVIIDAGYIPENSADPDALAKTIKLSDIQKNKLDRSDILYVAFSGKQIGFMVLNNVTKDFSSFGIVTECDKQRGSSVYTMDVDGKESTYTVNGILRPGKGSAVEAVIADNKIISMSELEKLNTYGKVSSFDKNNIVIGGSSYRLSKNCKFYVQDYNYNYTLMSYDDVKDEDMSNCLLYADEPIEDGGLVRIIKIQK